MTEAQQVPTLLASRKQAHAGSNAVKPEMNTLGHYNAFRLNNYTKNINRVEAVTWQ